MGLRAFRYRPMALWFMIILLVAFDQATKYWALHTLPEQGSIALMPGVQAILSFNSGVAFGLLANFSGWQQILSIGLAVVVLVAGGYALYKPWVRPPLDGCVALLMAGALGNTIDRVLWGHVIDFIDCFIGQWHWYTFNVADIALSLGAIGWLVIAYCKPECMEQGVKPR